MECMWDRSNFSSLSLFPSVQSWGQSRTWPTLCFRIQPELWTNCRETEYSPTRSPTSSQLSIDFNSTSSTNKISPTTPTSFFPMPMNWPWREAPCPRIWLTTVTHRCAIQSVMRSMDWLNFWTRKGIIPNRSFSLKMRTGWVSSPITSNSSSMSFPWCSALTLSSWCYSRLSSTTEYPSTSANTPSMEFFCS